MGDAVKRIAIIGSTGSIGQQTLDVVRAQHHQFQIVGLTAGQNTALLARQINEFKPGFVHYQAKDKQPQPTKADDEFMLPATPKWIQW